MKNSQGGFATIFFVVLLLLAGIGFYYFSHTYTFCSSGSLGIKKIINTAVEERKPSFCSHVIGGKMFCGMGPTQQELIDECYRDVGIKLDNVDVCKNMSKSNWQCYREIAVKRGDISICNNINDDIIGFGYCQSYFAQNSNNIEMCNILGNSQDKDICFISYAERLKDINICSNKVMNNKDGCYRVVAAARKDVSICSKISDISMKNECETTISYYLDKINN